jgi:uncharacterized protein (DUF58 family)
LGLSSPHRAGKSTPPPGQKAWWRRRPPLRPGRSSRITGEGVLFILLSILLGMAAVNTGHNLLYLVFSVMLAMLLLSAWLARINLWRLRLERRYPVRFHAGEPCEAEMLIHNGKRMAASYALRVVDHAALESNPELARSMTGFVPMAANKGRAEVHLSIDLPRRGVWRLGPAEVTSRFPFGLFRHRWRALLPGELMIYPRLISLQSIAAGQGPPGEMDSEARGQGSNLYGIRDYQMGDPARHIHWKHSAKGQGIKLKEFEEERAQAYRLVIDPRVPADPPDGLLDDFEKAVSVAASLAHDYLGRGIAVGLWTGRGHIPIGNGPRQLQRVMAALARIEADPGGQQAPALDPEAGHVTTCWIDFQGPPPRPRARSAAWPLERRIDARRVAWPEPNGDAPDHGR